jgi:hypothetical protein
MDGRAGPKRRSVGDAACSVNRRKSGRRRGADCRTAEDRVFDGNRQSRTESIPAIAPALRPTETWELSTGVWNASGSTYRPSMAVAGKCSCISGIRAIHGVAGKMLLHFRHSGHPWRRRKNAPAFPAFGPSMAVKKRPGDCPADESWSETGYFFVW